MCRRISRGAPSIFTNLHRRIANCQTIFCKVCKRSQSRHCRRDFGQVWWTSGLASLVRRRPSKNLIFEGYVYTVPYTYGGMIGFGLASEDECQAGWIEVLLMLSTVILFHLWYCDPFLSMNSVLCLAEWHMMDLTRSYYDVSRRPSP